MSKENMITSAAVDEIYVLRSLMAFEALAIEATLEMKSVPKSRRPILEKQAERMRLAANGKWREARNMTQDGFSDRLRHCYEVVTEQKRGSGTMTNQQWLKEKGLLNDEC